MVNSFFEVAAADDFGRAAPAVEAEVRSAVGVETRGNLGAVDAAGVEIEGDERAELEPSPPRRPRVSNFAR